MRKRGLLTILLLLITIAYILHFKNEEVFTPDKYKVDDAVVESIINENINESMSDYEKVKTIHDYIVNTTVYDHDNLVNNTIPDVDYTAKGVLENNIAVCRGYAEAFKLLMNELGIECEILTGKADNISHAWNVVKIDNEWYQVDCTFDDPVTTDGVRKDTLRYDYFLITDEQMYLDHIADSNSYICSSDKYMYQEKEYGVPYYILNSVYQLSTQLQLIYDRGEKKATFYFPDSEDVAENIFNNVLPTTLGYIQGVRQYTYTPVNQCGKYYYTTITVS